MELESQCGDLLRNYHQRSEREKKNAKRNSTIRQELKPHSCMPPWNQSNCSFTSTSGQANILYVVVPRESFVLDNNVSNMAVAVKVLYSLKCGCFAHTCSTWQCRRTMLWAARLNWSGSNLVSEMWKNAHSMSFCSWVMVLNYGQKSVVAEHDDVIVKLTLDILD